MFYLQNLSSRQLEQGIAPWDFKPTETLSEEIRTDKAKRDAWINLPSTRHHVYTLNEGLNSNLRISKPRKDGEGNPVVKSDGLVGDYDIATKEEIVLARCRAFAFPPNRIERTLSGNWRPVWFFEVPVNWPSFEFYKHFMRKFAEVAFDPSRLIPGFDKGAWEAPERLWTNGCDWFSIHDKPLGADLVRGWIAEASKSYPWTEKEFGPAIPIEALAPELAKKFHRFSEWPSSFTLNSTGPTFWVEASVSPKSATVRETGMQTYSAHAPKAFYPWAELVGGDFCKAYKAEAAGKAVKEIYYDGKSYFRREDSGQLSACDRANIVTHLKAARGVSFVSDGQASDMDRALEFIHSFQRVVGAGSFVYQPEGIIIRGEDRYLNTSRKRVLQPAPGPSDPALIPFFLRLNECLFPNPAAREYINAWAALFYRSCYIQQPLAGQHLVIAGGVGVGKTLYSRGVLGTIFGGFAEPHDWLLGRTSFNSELFTFGLWAIDDMTMSGDEASHRVFSAAMKKMAANITYRVNEKFRVPTMIDWIGRIVLTCNPDEESIRAIPNMDISILDKLSLLRAADVPLMEFPGLYEIRKTLAAEAPHIARYWLDYEIPAHLVGSSRFGLVPYHDPSLLQVSQQSSGNSGFAEILEDWCEEYFTKREPDAEKWEGTCFQLHKEIMLDPTAESAMRPFGVTAIGKHLSALKNKGWNIESFSRGNTRLWRINKPTKTKQ